MFHGPGKSLYSPGTLYTSIRSKVSIRNIRLPALFVLDLHLRIRQSYTYHLVLCAIALNTVRGEKQELNKYLL